MAESVISTYSVNNPREDMTAESLRALVSYDPETGHFYKRGRRFGWKHRVVGYRYLTIDGHHYKEHRLAWLFVHGQWPDGQVDHVNRIRDDNSLSNLRVVTGSQNQANTGLAVNNTSGVRGVCFSNAHGKFVAAIKKDGRRIHLGYFETLPDAARARKAGELIYGPTAA